MNIEKEFAEVYIKSIEDGRRDVIAAYSMLRYKTEIKTLEVQRFSAKMDLFELIVKALLDPDNSRDDIIHVSDGVMHNVRSCKEVSIDDICNIIIHQKKVRS